MTFQYSLAGLFDKFDHFVDSLVGKYFYQDANLSQRLTLD
ncbi:hypothetical protein FDUTEX481_00167 [Tolypothrix sp. PCC 7601]|nr:hypothetical protein FDUTEX481_00167 [Tolypothrix sp. PCC 7601]